MLVLGTTRPDCGAGQPSRGMGPVARACLRSAHCPVVVVALDDLPENPPGQQHGPWRPASARRGRRPPAVFCSPPRSALVPACLRCATSLTRFRSAGPPGAAARARNPGRSFQRAGGGGGSGASAPGEHRRRARTHHRAGPPRCRADNGCGAGRGRPRSPPMPVGAPRRPARRRCGRRWSWPGTRPLGRWPAPCDRPY